MRASALTVALVLNSLESPAYAQSWEIPRNATTVKSPLSASPTVLRNGRTLYVSKCAKCHGPEGKGDGPDTTNDAAHRPADLTSGFRASLNPDGVLFYKIWNGRTQPTMPAFKGQLTRDEVWAVVAYVKTLRKAPDQ